MGWYMVKSGLEDRFDKPTDVPRVSQYRLASHLGLAFILYSFLLTNSLRILLPVKVTGLVTKKFLGLAMAAKGLVFLTAMSGVCNTIFNIFKLVFLKHIKYQSNFLSVPFCDKKILCLCSQLKLLISIIFYARIMILSGI